MVLGEGARFLVRRGFAQERDKADMLATLEHARALGLTHITDNVREHPSFICNCCGACVPICSQGAISLVERARRPRPPKTRGRLLARILWEKGRLWPFLLDGSRRLLAAGASRTGRRRR